MKEILYSKGDWIVHAQYGVGEVKGVDSKSLNGQEKRYLRVQTLDGEYWLPSDRMNVDYIRPIASSETFRGAMTTIRKSPEPLNGDHKVRAKEISAQLENGALIRVARLIRDLYGRGRIEKLNMSEEDTYNRIRKRFIDEWVIAAGLEREEAEQRLEEALVLSVKKVLEEK
ncbi:MAG TPA: CarD family transcriptional regulator [Anaerolineales bacterium]|nr:CarD family transcriptional regulator [Anaerolineales bacterium]